MSTATKGRSTKVLRIVFLVALATGVFWDVTSTVARKLAGVASYAAADLQRMVDGSKDHPALFDPIAPPAPAQKSVVGVCQSTDAELGGLSAPLSATLTYAQVDSITRLAVQRAGGLANLVAPGDWVAIKPNILHIYDQSAIGYEWGGIGVAADLRVVKSLVEQLVEEGDASRITIAEGGTWHNMDSLPPTLQGVQTVDGWTCHWPEYDNLSYEDMVADFNTTYPGITFDIFDMNYPPYNTGPVPGGGLAGTQYTTTGAFDCDVLIPVATMKTHVLSRMTGTHKHYIGSTPGTVYGIPGYGLGMNKMLLPHDDNVEKVLIDLFSYHPADFALVECIWGMEGNGPDSGPSIKRNVVLAGRDPVAVDAVDAYVMGMNPWDIDHLHYSHNKGFGTYDLDYVTVNGPALDLVRYEFTKPVRGPGYYLGRGNRIWLVNGTYDGSTNLDAEQLGAGVEASISPVPGDMTQGNEWTVAQFTDAREFCDLGTYYGGASNCVAYAFTRIVADTAQTAYLRFGAADGMKIWLNGSVVYNSAAVGGAGWSKVEAGVAISLTAGVNRLLIKNSNASGSYGFSLFTTESSTDGDTPLGIEYTVTPTGIPEVILNSPMDAMVTLDSLVDLETTVTDSDGDSMTVSIYGGATTAATDLLYLAEDVASGTHLTYTQNAPVLQVTSDTRGLWHFNGNSGTTVTDASGNGNTGTITGAAWTTAGKFGPGLDFSPGDLIDMGTSATLNPTHEVTFEAWIRIEQLSDVQNLGAKIVGRDYYAFLFVQTDAGVRWEIMQSGTVYDWTRCDAPAGSVPMGEWAYVVGSCDSNGVMKTYVNGQMLATLSLGGTLNTSSNTTWVGWWPDHLFDGRIDEVRISDRALTDAEIQANYGLGEGTYFWKATADDGVNTATSATRSFTVIPGGPDLGSPILTLNAPADAAQFTEGDPVDLDVTVSDPEFSPLEVRIYGDTAAVPTTLLHYANGLASPTDVVFPWAGGPSEFSVTSSTVGLWHFNENSGTTAGDETGSHDGVVSNAGWSAGRFGSALSFSSDDRVEIPDSPDWATPQLTVQAWVYPSFYVSGYHCVVTKGTLPEAMTPLDLGYALLVDNNGKVDFAIGNSDGSGWAVIGQALSASALTAGAWHHVAATYDGAHVRIYINGDLDSNGTANPYAYSGGLHYAAGPIDIGSSFQRTTADSWYGLIDEVRISDAALSASAIQETFALAADRYYWYAEASDTANNTTVSATRYFDVASSGPDLLPPSITLNAPADGAQFPEGASVDLDLTVSDPETSPVEVWVYGDTSFAPTTLLHHESGLASPADVLYTWGGGEAEFAVTGNTVALWHFNENTGTTAADETGGHDGVVSNASWATGRFGSALTFGGDDRVEIPDSPDWNTPQLTIQAWVNASSLPSSYNCVLTKGTFPEGGGSIDMAYAFLVNGSGQIDFAIGNSDGSGWAIIGDAVSSTGLVPGTWYHLAVTYDGAHVRIYIDGDLDSNGTANPHAYSGGLHYGVGPLDFGSSFQRTTADSWFGLIDEARISNVALSATEIQASYALAADRYYWYATASDTAGHTSTSTTRYFDLGLNDPPEITLNAPADGAQIAEGSTVVLDATVTDPESGALEVWVYGDTSATPATLLHHESGVSSPASIQYTWGGGESEFPVTGNTVALWHLNENTGTAASDETGNHPGTVTNPTWESGRFGSALRFGGDDRVEVPDSPDWDTPELTIQAWVNATALTSSYNCIVTKGSYPTPVDLGYALCVYDGQLVLLIGNSDGSGWDVLQDAMGGTTLSTATWYHVAATYDGAEVRIYIDGVLDSNGTANPYAFTGGMHYSAGPIEIGSSLQQATADSWDGLIDEVRISDAALSESEIQASYALSADRYYWYVMASDVAGGDSTSFTRYFDIVADAPPSVPTLVAPADAALTTDNTPAFVWSETAGGGTYTLQYALDAGFTTGVQTVTGLTDTTHTVAGAIGDDTYYWHVQAFNTGGDSSGYQTTPYSFTVDTQAPLVPTLINPADLSISTDNTPTFDWSATAGSGGTYTLQYALDLGFTTGVQIVTDLTDTTYTVAGALGDDTYYWHVLAVDAASNASGYQTTPFSFTLDTQAPAVPTLINPADLAVTADNTPTFEWSATAGGGGTYTLEYALDAGFTAGVQTVTDLTDTTYAVPGALGDDTYYWHVLAIDAASNSSGYQTTPFSFTVDTQAPAVPTLINPADLTITGDNTPTFVWSATAGGGGIYTLEYALDAGFSTGVSTITAIADTTYTLAGALGDDTYYWHVLAIDAASNVSGYQATPFSFTVNTALPDIPTLIAPADLAVTNDNTPTLTWSEAGGADTYTLQYALDAAFTTGLQMFTGLSDTDYSVVTALADDTYHWRVQAFNSAGDSSGYQAVPFSFTVDTQAPVAPVLISPPDLTVTSEATPTFTWSATAGAGGTYTLEYALDAGFTTGVQTVPGISDTTHAVAGALADDTYYWHVQAIDAAANSSGYQTPYSFTVNTTLPPVPTLVNPPDLSATSDHTPTFDWSATAGAGGTYTLQYALDAAFTSGVVTVADIADSTYTVPPLLPGGIGLLDNTYYWHVQAVDSESNASGYQSVPFSFTVDTEVPAAPTLISPADLAIIDDTTPEFFWSSTAGSGGSYTLEVASDSDFTFAMTVSGLTDTTYVSGSPLMEGEYYWHVKAIDQADNESGYQSSPYSFTLSEGAPPVPSLISPADSLFMCDTTPTFAWQDGLPALAGERDVNAPGASSEVASYTLQYSTDPAFADATTVAGIVALAYTVPDGSDLDRDIYYWRVEAVDVLDHQSGYQAHPFRFGIFAPGDQNGDHVITASDVIYLVNYTFKGGPTPVPCEAAGDVNCDVAVTASDVIYLVNHTFKGGPAPCDVGALIADGTWSCP